MATFTMTAVEHADLGPLLRLTVGPGPAVDLTAEEAAVLSRALIAVFEGADDVPEIVLTPTAHDRDFTMTVHNHGVVVGATHLNWRDVRVLSQALSGM